MSGFDELIHQPVRLRIMSALASQKRDTQLEFTYLRDLLELTDGNLGAHLAKLEQAEYIRLEKSFIDRKPRTFIAPTDLGRHAFNGHVEALESVLRGAPATREETE